MTRCTEKINPHLLHINRFCSCCLGCVNNQIQPILTSQLRKLCDGQNCSEHIRSMRYNDRACVGADQRAKGRYGLIAVKRNARRTISDYTACCKRMHRAQHGIMLKIGNNYMVAKAQKPFDHCIERIGTILCEHHVLNVLRAEKTCDLGAHFKYLLCRFNRKVMSSASRIRTITCQCSINSILYDKRFWKGRSGIIKINHWGFPLFISEIFTPAASRMETARDTSPCTRRPYPQPSRLFGNGLRSTYAEIPLLSKSFWPFIA